MDCLSVRLPVSILVYHNVYRVEGGRPIDEEDREQRLIPDINFTCHGFITKWILAAEWDDEDIYPELQTWNSTDGITYTKQGATTFSLEGGSAEMTYYEYSPNPPHEFNDGDVLGSFIPDNPRYIGCFLREQTVVQRITCKIWLTGQEVISRPTVMVFG